MWWVVVSMPCVSCCSYSVCVCVCVRSAESLFQWFVDARASYPCCFRWWCCSCFDFRLRLLFFIFHAVAHWFCHFVWFVLKSIGVSTLTQLNFPKSQLAKSFSAIKQLDFPFLCSFRKFVHGMKMSVCLPCPSHPSHSNQPSNHRLALFTVSILTIHIYTHNWICLSLTLSQTYYLKSLPFSLQMNLYLSRAFRTPNHFRPKGMRSLWRACACFNMNIYSTSN